MGSFTPVFSLQSVWRSRQAGTAAVVSHSKGAVLRGWARDWSDRVPPPDGDVSSGGRKRP